MQSSTSGPGPAPDPPAAAMPTPPTHALTKPHSRNVSDWSQFSGFTYATNRSGAMPEEAGVVELGGSIGGDGDEVVEGGRVPERGSCGYEFEVVCVKARKG